MPMSSSTLRRRGLSLTVCEARASMATRPPSPLLSARSTDRKSTRLNSSHLVISYAVFCLKKKNAKQHRNKTFVYGTASASYTTAAVQAPIFFLFTVDGIQLNAGIVYLAIEKLHCLTAYDS